LKQSNLYIVYSTTTNRKTSWVVQLELLIIAWLTWTWKRTEKNPHPYTHTKKKTERQRERERERVQLPNTANSKGKMQLN